MDSTTMTLGVKAYAETFGLGVSTVRKYIRNGKLDAIKDELGQWSIECEAGSTTNASSDGMLVLEKEKQIQLLQEQIEFLKESLQDKTRSEERLQQIILSQSILNQPRLTMWSKLKTIFSQEQKHV